VFRCPRHELLSARWNRYARAPNPESWAEEFVGELMSGRPTKQSEDEQQDEENPGA
jgi:hypothetical protein